MPADGQKSLQANLAVGGNRVRQIIRAVFFLAIGGFDRRQVQPLAKHGRTPGHPRCSANGGGVAEGQNHGKGLGPCTRHWPTSLQANPANGGNRVRQIIRIRSGLVHLRPAADGSGMAEGQQRNGRSVTGCWFRRWPMTASSESGQRRKQGTSKHPSLAVGNFVAKQGIGQGEVVVAVGVCLEA